MADLALPAIRGMNPGRAKTERELRPTIGAVIHSTFFSGGINLTASVTIALGPAV